ncbi:unnamed protein product [Mesocestoides corti]|uniref:GT23 domain-containing protein n=1 Tax=Mesocestoides corti TaxID=53468 RepID=A0A0R3UKF9_MESCO|nr:unnamed protein product [Mesocestoides corti]
MRRIVKLCGIVAIICTAWFLLTSNGYMQWIETQLRDHEPLNYQEYPTDRQQKDLDEESNQLGDYNTLHRQALSIALHLSGTLIGSASNWSLEMASRLIRMDELGGHAERRRRKLVRLGERFQKQLFQLQHPTNCSAARFVETGLPTCGFGCQIHHIALAMQLAVATNRTLFVHGFDQTFHGLFLPLTNCIEIGINQSVIKQEFVNSAPVTPLFPPALPAEWASLLQPLHESPYLWLRGHMIKYAIRLTDATLSQQINTTISSLRHEGYGQVYVGIHIRRTDKLLGEASSFPVSSYIAPVDQYYKLVDACNELKRTQNDARRRNIFLASDESTVYSEARQKYSMYAFHEKGTTFQTNSDVNSRVTKEGIKSICFDVMLLAHADFLVCTFSSNVCRMAHALKQALNDHYGDRTQQTVSVDMSYYIIGSQESIWKVWLDYSPQAKRGDLVTVYKYSRFASAQINGTTWVPFFILQEQLILLPP